MVWYIAFMISIFIYSLKKVIGELCFLNDPWMLVQHTWLCFCSCFLTGLVLESSLGYTCLCRLTIAISCTNNFCAISSFLYFSY